MGYSPLKLEKTQTIMRKLRKLPGREDILNDDGIVRSALKTAAYSDKFLRQAQTEAININVIHL